MTPAPVLLARLENELETALLALNAGRLDTAVQAMERAIVVGKQVREAL